MCLIVLFKTFDPVTQEVTTRTTTRDYPRPSSSRGDFCPNHTSGHTLRWIYYNYVCNDRCISCGGLRYFSFSDI